MTKKLAVASASQNDSVSFFMAILLLRVRQPGEGAGTEDFDSRTTISKKEGQRICNPNRRCSRARGP